MTEENKEKEHLKWNTAMAGDHFMTKEKQLFRLKNVSCFGRIAFIEKIKQTPILI